MSNLYDNCFGSSLAQLADEVRDELYCVSCGANRRWLSEAIVQGLGERNFFEAQDLIRKCSECHSYFSTDRRSWR